MEQGRARERATGAAADPDTGACAGEAADRSRPPHAQHPSYGGPVRVPEQTRGEEPTPLRGEAAALVRGGTAAAVRAEAGSPVRGEHTHSEPPAPRPAPAAGSPRPVRRHSVRGQILQALRTALVGGELVPGEVYSAPVLAERFGVSATPVREAMQQLAVEGAVEVVPNRGFRVTERTPRELAELAEVRALIEVPVMLRLARTVPAARWAELKPLAEATATAAARGDRAHYAEADRAFHRAVLSLAGNEQLLAVADDLHRRSQWPLVSGPVIRHGDLVADAAEHTALLDALIAQDVTVVQSLVREHFTGSAD
ncbi:GntR family transcriptional regulator [Streptomyces sp. NPDC090127]|uniref:GntR family transcriptional regulator n=1 Tax=Streptomyces sp. NPDC090127 TaxID=3365953 RepID=UPI0038289D12